MDYGAGAFSGEDGGGTRYRQEEPVGRGDGPVVWTGQGGRRVGGRPEEGLQGIDHGGPQQLW